ncbi:hypothetical protein, partial [Streptomyces shenzhenensis]|uniref:hypothetical protein n=1 Tax=Streptomyces shenzhenensis TaxID=943815 RepID=UPI001C689F61
GGRDVRPWPRSGCAPLAALARTPLAALREYGEYGEYDRYGEYGAYAVVTRGRPALAKVALRD